jgi:hypothetical protein
MDKDRLCTEKPLRLHDYRLFTKGRRQSSAGLVSAADRVGTSAPMAAQEQKVQAQFLRNCLRFMTTCCSRL